MATYIKKIQAEKYDGSAASVDRIMDMLGRTQGVNNSDTCLFIDNMRIEKGRWVTLFPNGTIGSWEESTLLENYVKDGD